jgi:hypothetical protein
VVRPLSRFAACLIYFALTLPARADGDVVSSVSELVNCIQGTLAARNVSCIVRDELTVITRGTAAITNGVIGATLPAGRVFDLEIRFEFPGCIVWNHLNAFPYSGDPTSSATSPVEVLKLLAPGLQGGSRVHIVNPCIREQRNGVAGGDASTVVYGISVTGGDANEAMVTTFGDHRISLRSTGAGTRDFRNVNVGDPTKPAASPMPLLQSINSTKSGRGLYIVDPFGLGNLNGPNFDVNGSIYELGCTLGVDDPNDGACAFLNDANYLFGLGNTSLFSTTLAVDSAQLGARQFCRRTLTPFEHGTGAGFETNMDTMTARTAFVRRRGANDTYTIGALDSQGHDCTAGTGAVNLRSYIGYTTDAADDAMLFSGDSVHPTTYGSRWLATQLLTARIEFQPPAVLGVPNLFGDAAYGETTGNCTTTWTATLAPTITSTAVQPASNDANTLNPIVGQGCEFQTPAASSTASSLEVQIEPSTYYVVQFWYSSNSVVATAAMVFDVVVENSAGTPLTVPVEKWYADGPAFGELTELTGALAQPLPARTGYGGFLVRGIFKTPEAADHVRVDVTSGGAGAFGIDELWMVKKIHQDPSLHYLIGDGAATIKVFTDSRGNEDTSVDRFPQAIDYMQGITNHRGLKRATPLRPGLELVYPAGSIAFTYSGGRLSDFVGPADGNLNFAGTAIPYSIGDALEGTSPTYCVALFGINDWMQGLRPTAQATRNLGFPDQIRGFEQYAERAGCVPILMTDYMAHGGVDTATYPAIRNCSDATGTAVACAEHYRTLLKSIFQTGIPR